MHSKTIVTHRNPHLDEIACIWLVKRFLPRWEACKVSYIPTNPKGGNVASPDKDPNKLYIGVGRGKFDEHKGNLDESATTLVHAFIFREKKVKLDSIHTGALEELVAYVNDDDHGLHITNVHSEFSYSAANAFMAKSGHTSGKILEAGLAYLDGVYACLIEKHTLLRDWKKAARITTKWGTAIAIQTTASPKTVLRKAALENVELAIVVNPENQFRSIRAVPKSDANFSDAFEIVRAKEPTAEWYLHHSKRMLICGSDVASNKVLSRMTLKQLSNVVAV